MSEDLVNQITLNFLISKTQLQKLNKKMQEKDENTRKYDREIYETRIKELLSDLLVNNPPDDLFQEVLTGFNFFVDKCIYYFKIHDNNLLIENERNEKDENEILDPSSKNNDKNNDKNNEEQISMKIVEYEDDEDVERGEYVEEEDDEDVEEGDEDVEEDEEDVESKSLPKTDTVNVYKKYNKNAFKSHSQGVEDIQKLPLDWFQNIRQNYKINKIIPRKKEVIIGHEGFRDKKNITK